MASACSSAYRRAKSGVALGRLTGRFTGLRMRFAGAGEFGSSGSAGTKRKDRFGSHEKIEHCEFATRSYCSRCLCSLAVAGVECKCSVGHKLAVEEAYVNSVALKEAEWLTSAVVSRQLLSRGLVLVCFQSLSCFLPS